MMKSFPIHLYSRMISSAVLRNHSFAEHSDGTIVFHLLLFVQTHSFIQTYSHLFSQTKRHTNKLTPSLCLYCYLFFFLTPTKYIFLFGAKCISTKLMSTWRDSTDVKPLMRTERMRLRNFRQRRIAFVVH